MARTLFRLLVAQAIIGIAGTTSAQDKPPTPIEAFQGVANYQYLMCRIEAQAAIMKFQAGEGLESLLKIGSCAREGKAAAKEVFPKANAQFAKKPTGSKLLKDYYAAWLSAMDDLQLNANEGRAAYSRRQAENEKKLNEMWRRFEVEVGL